MLVHPLVNLLLEMTATLRMVDSLAGQDLTINTAIEMGRVSIRASGVEMAMAAPPPAEVAEAAGEAAAAEEPTAFVRWCEQSSCRAGFDAGVTCEQVDRDLQTGGAVCVPIILVCVLQSPCEHANEWVRHQN